LKEILMSETITVDTVREVLREELAKVLYSELDAIDEEANFETLGLDSVLSVELTAFINSRYRLAEKMEVIYQNPTLNQLAQHVVTVVTGGAVTTGS
jgi:acyl carrier protein